MTLQEIQSQALRLALGDRWRLVQSLLSSIQQETEVPGPPIKTVNSLNALAELNPWTQSLIGVIQLGTEEPELDDLINYGHQTPHGQRLRR
jgi:hypothetical protein